jgi:asparagine synthase (glutamine-hydrolysing)
MCGILGTLNLPFGEEALNLISHRGPDDSGIIDMAVGEHHITLGHRRLSILDVSAAGHQPMQTPCGRYSLIYNGEIYNHLDLRREIKTVEFRGHSDTETILHCISQHGIDGIQKFNGIFAFGFVDAEEGKLFLARDPFGVKPLYYCQRGRTFVFSSEIGPIKNLIESPLDPESLAEVLRLRYLPSPDTLFQDIKKVRPGHVIEVDLYDVDLRCKEYPYFHIPQATIDIAFQEAVNRYGIFFEEAVHKQLMSDVDVGILLSGGIDSSLVASYAQKQTSYRMKAFTVGFTEHDYADEISDARETASILGLDHYYCRMGFEDFLAVMRKCIHIIEEPLATTSIIPMYYLSKLASQYVKVVLSGQGADECLGGYVKYQSEIRRAFIPSALARVMGSFAHSFGLQNELVLRGLHSLAEKDDVTRFLNTYTVFDDDKIHRLIGIIPDNRASERLHYWYDVMGCGGREKTVERMMALELRTILPDDYLLYTDKITMHHSVECRVPMLDLNLVDFVESLPCDYRVKLLHSKIIHKRFARRSLPKSIINRRKKGFLSPTNVWFKRTDDLRDVLLDSSSKFASFFDLREVDNVLDEHRNGLNRERHIFLLLNLYYWMAEFV